MNELVEKISMWRNELERQNAHQGIYMVFDSICVYLGEQHRIYEKVRNSLCSSNRERVEERDRLLEENKRLTSKNKTTWEIAEEQEVDITECRNENQRLLKESQLYKELYTKVNTQNMVYKAALEENIPILRNVLQVIKNQVDYDEGITLGGVIVQLEKALEVDTNE